MKALIWIGCIGLFAAVEIVTALTGRELGVMPTILLAAASFLLARVLSLRYDEAQKRKRAEERRRAAEKE